MGNEYNELREAGWSHDMAKALCENGLGPLEAQGLSPYEALDKFLTWNGIIGWTSQIIEALDNCRDQSRVGAK